jgi:NitT/TauT family transport system permease protein
LSDGDPSARDGDRQGAADAGPGVPVVGRPPAAWRSLIAFRGITSHATDIYLGVIGFLICLALWVLLTSLELVRPQALAAPQAVLAKLYELFVRYGFAGDIGISVFRVWAAFLLSAAMAIPLGILMSSFRLANGLLEPVVDFIRYIPVPALIPLTIFWLGVGEESKIALLWIGTFFQLLLLVADDGRRVPREYVEIGMTVGAKPRQLIRCIVFPAMLPNMVDNLRITLGWCWTYVIIAEFVVADSGVGNMIMNARRYVKTPDVMAGALTIGIIGLLTDQLIRWAHRRYFAYLR